MIQYRYYAVEREAFFYSYRPLRLRALPIQGIHVLKVEEPGVKLRVDIFERSMVREIQFERLPIAAGVFLFTSIFLQYSERP